MNRYFADLSVTEETVPPTDVTTCERISVTVVAPNLDRALSLVRDAVGTDVWSSKRILEFGIEENGPEQDAAAEAVVQGPDREELVRFQEQGLMSRLKKLMSRHDVQV